MCKSKIISELHYEIGGIEGHITLNIMIDNWGWFMEDCSQMVKHRNGQYAQKQLLKTKTRY